MFVPKCEGNIPFFNFPSTFLLIRVIFDLKFKLIRNTPTTMFSSLMARVLYTTGVNGETGEHIFTDTSRTLSNQVISFRFTVPSYNVTTPILNLFSIRAVRSCEDLSPISIPNCKWEHPCRRSCGPRIFGRRICVNICSPIPIPTKSNLQLKLEPYNVPAKTLLNVPSTIVNFNVAIIPEIEFDMQTLYRITNLPFPFFDASLELTMGKISKLDYTLQFEITKLILGFTFKINNIQMTVGGIGINLNNIEIPLIPKFDICGNGRKIVSQTNKSGELTLWYLLGKKSITLYDIINDLIISGTPEIVINFCKQTKIEFQYGLLFCPKNTVMVSFVVFSTTKLSPFKDLNRFDIPDIPNLDVPDIPSIPGLPIPDEWRRRINNLDTALNQTTSKVTEATRIIKDILENFQTFTYTELRIPIIVKSG